MPSAKKIHLPPLRVADISTSHITPRDRELITQESTPGVCLTGECGALVYLPIDADMSDRKAAGFSDAFFGLLEVARENGFGYIRFDACGATVPGLELFE